MHYGVCYCMVAPLNDILILAELSIPETNGVLARHLAKTDI